MQINEKTVLAIDNLSIAYKRPDGSVSYLVKNLSLTIQSQECVALVGESGSGKTLTALSILKLLDDPNFFYPTGAIYFEGVDLLSLSEKELRTIRGNQICMIFQEPMVSLNPLHTIEKQLKEVFSIHKKISKKEMKQTIIQSLKKVGIVNAQERLSHYPHQLSGGERQRVMIAMAILTRPKLLIADEPTTALDVSIQMQIIKLLQELKYELGMSILFISHNLPIVKKIANRIAVMKSGEIVECDYRHCIFLKPKDPYTIKLINSSPKGEPIPLPEEKKMLLKVRGLTVTHKVKTGLFKSKQVTIVDRSRFNIHFGECVGIIGESGSGKTTTALAILRLIKSTGKIKFNGVALESLSQKKLLPFRSQIQIVFQDPFSSLNPKFTVQQIIEEGLLIHTELKAKEREERVIAMMQELELNPDERFRYPHEFSGGQRQRIAIARVLILEPKLIILDEPTSSLDLTIQLQIIELLKRLQTTHRISYLLISHDLAVIHSLCHHIIVMKEGKIIEQGSRDDLFKQPQHDYTKQLLSIMPIEKPKQYKLVRTLFSVEKRLCEEGEEGDEIE